MKYEITICDSQPKADGNTMTIELSETDMEDLFYALRKQDKFYIVRSIEESK